MSSRLFFNATGPSRRVKMTLHGCIFVAERKKKLVTGPCVYTVRELHSLCVYTEDNT